MSNTNKNIIDLLGECSYNPSFKDYIIKILIELSCQKGVVFYKTVLPGNPNKIVAIKYPMNIRLKGNSYEIKINIYITTEFPEKPPEIYIDYTNDSSLAVNTKNPNVNPDNFKIITNKLYNWTKFTSLQEILTEIINSFEQNFPIYKKQQKAPQVNISNQSMMQNNPQFNNANNINNSWNFNNQGNFNINNMSINPPTQNKNPAPVINPQMGNFNNTGPLINPMNNPSINNFNNFNNPQQNSMNNSFIDNKKSSPEAEIKKLLIEEIKISCESKLKDDLKRLRSQEEKLSNYKQVFTTQIEKLRNFINKKDEHYNSSNVLMHEMEQDRISKTILLEKFSGQTLNQNNCLDFVTIKNPNNNLLETLAMEATVEDIFIIIKRAFEKGNVSFNDTVKFIRNLSREAIKIKYIRDKIKKGVENKL